jgi:C4-dicarboxylate-specific signal transduction histidine kinase
MFSLREGVEDTLQRISKIIQGLRTVSRNTDEDIFDKLRFRVIIDDVLGLCSERFKSHGVELEIDLENPLFEEILYCDQVQLSQVILNMVNNSYDAVEVLETKWVKVTLEKEQNDFILTITDSGDGIDEEVRDKMFQPFFTSKPIGKGTGLGLSISSNIIEKHGGSLSLDLDNKNTSFVIKLPIVKRS